jgi:hypothetical protein
MSTLTVGLNEITVANAGLFWSRLALAERIGGAVLDRAPITAADVHRHIGLRTNAPVLDDEAWAAELRTEVLEPIRSLYEREYARTYE